MKLLSKYFFSTLLLSLISYCLLGDYTSDVEAEIINKTEQINAELDEKYGKTKKQAHRISGLKTKEDAFYSEIINTPDSVFEYRINKINEYSPIKFQYNEYVANYIYAYGVQNTKKIQDIIELSQYYFPIFEDYLSAYNLPLELKYLAAVESALDPNAISVSFAVGLWQFVKNTSDILDLQVNSYIDERRDVYKSTNAACIYLEFLYRTFNDWHLALAAYNGGPGMVSKSIARSGGKTDYWKLRPYFTDQMQNYVPAFIAMAYLLNYHEHHYISPDKEKYLDFYNYDTLVIYGPLMFEQIENVIGLSAEKVSKMNPMFINNKIPADGQKYSLVLPRNSLIKFILRMPDIFINRPVKKTYTDIITSPVDTIGRELIHHTVLRGETLNRIAIEYGVTVHSIRYWNNLEEDYVLRFDDVLKIWVD